MIAGKPRPARATWKNRRWTFDELAAELPESNLPTELWDGELIMSPAPSFFHQKIVARLYKALDAWVEQHRLGETALAPIDMVLTARHATQPDVVFIANEHLGIIKERIMGAADLVAEVLSPGSRRRDRIDKRDLYEQHGVHEYWLIDSEARTVEVLALAAGTYQLVGRWHPGERASKADRRLQELMDRNNEGDLTEGEHEELEALAELSERLSLVRAKALQILREQPR